MPGMAAGEAIHALASVHQSLYSTRRFVYPEAPGWDFAVGLGSFDISAIGSGAADAPACAATSTIGRKK